MNKSINNSVNVVKKGEWNKVLKQENIKNVSFIGGKNDADYKILFHDYTEKYYKF